MAARYAYYHHSISIMSDKEYDDRESDYVLVSGELPVGSERVEDYTPAQRALAMYFIFSGRAVK